MTLQLILRTPIGVLLDQPVRSIRAEDLDGWFGIAPGRAELCAVLPPGLLLFTDVQGEGFVALSSGLLHLERDRCRVLARGALLSRKLSELAEEVAQRLRERQQRAELQRSVLFDLAREALLRMSREVRS